MKRKQTFRVFVTRQYTAVEWFDVVAPTAERARRLALDTVSHAQPDPRESATDSGWTADKPVTIKHIGQSEGGKEPMREIRPGVHQCAA